MKAVDECLLPSSFLLSGIREQIEEKERAMSKYNKENIIRLVEKEDVEFMRLQFTDIFDMM